MEAKRMDLTPVAFALLTFLLWGSTNFLVKYGTTEGIARPQIVAVMWLVCGLAGVIFFSYLVLTGQFSLSLNSQLLIPLAAGTFLALGLLSFTYGVAMGHTGSIAAIATANSAFTTLLAYFFLHEDLNIQQIAGIGAIIAGLVLLASSH